jgi:hypothetical protein
VAGLRRWSTFFAKAIPCRSFDLPVSVRPALKQNQVVHLHERRLFGMAPRYLPPSRRGGPNDHDLEGREARHVRQMYEGTAEAGVLR